MPLLGFLSPATVDLINHCFFAVATVVNLVLIMPWALRKCETLPKTESYLRGAYLRVFISGVLFLVLETIFIFCFHHFP